MKGKSHSLHDRVEGLKVASEYLQQNRAGTGAGLGIITVQNSISVGYAIAILESGVFGGFLYVLLFGVMAFCSIKMLFTSTSHEFSERVKVVVLLSVCSVLMMGAQRMQPDMSFWHMWIYAMFFYLTANSDDNLIKKSASDIKKTTF